MADSVRNPPNLKVLLYCDMGSQPARCITAFCRMTGIEHEVKLVAMRKYEHQKEPYISINPTKQIPSMQEVDKVTGETFTMGESHAILRYLADSRACPDHWYPRDLR